ncbi:hypothetical protein HOV23_gp075 [Pseudomonas phage Lana]|uniref:Uncharacterized protein n=1 Tax=Pseudomonas phage Lana TaxID=2530172 RepID=A0A481W782_9CAUD|nr:hypothetical protein HOV23_gp075 [Pseudomonas phage Lana]QBJ04498.1 hypothetical protein [Pseudomonas phage Lana]
MTDTVDLCYPKSKTPTKLSDVSCARGAPMGRRNILEAPANFTGTLHLNLMKMVDYCYDTGGAYWGAPTSLTGWMYRAWYYADVGDEVVHIEMFIRAVTRRAAKQQVLKGFPKARFYK